MKKHKNSISDVIDVLKHLNYSQSENVKKQFNEHDEWILILTFYQYNGLPDKNAYSFVKAIITEGLEYQRPQFLIIFSQELNDDNYLNKSEQYCKEKGYDINYIDENFDKLVCFNKYVLDKFMKNLNFSFLDNSQLEKFERTHTDKTIAYASVKKITLSECGKFVTEITKKLDSIMLYKDQSSTTEFVSPKEFFESNIMKFKNFENTLSRKL